MADVQQRFCVWRRLVCLPPNSHQASLCQQKEAASACITTAQTYHGWPSVGEVGRYWRASFAGVGGIMKRTPWFPCSTPPVWNGWYECSHGGVFNADPCMMYFRDG